MFGNRIAYRTWQLVAGTLHIVVERELRIKLRIDVFGLLHFRLFGLYTSLLSHIHMIEETILQLVDGTERAVLLERIIFVCIEYNNIAEAQGLLVVTANEFIVYK